MGTEDLLRTDITDEIVGHLRLGTNVNLQGMRSSGRSTVLNHVTQRLTESDIPVVHIAGIRALRSHALGALAVAGIDITPSTNSLQTLMSAVADLEANLVVPSSVLIIDDTQDLDPESVGVIAAAQAKLSTPILTTSRPIGLRRSDVAGQIAELQSGVRISLPPLRFDEVHRLVHEMLGGPADPSLVARIAAKSGGLPGLVAAMIATGRHASRIAPRGGRWVARGDLWTAPLGQAVEPLLAELNEDCLEALALLSHAGAINMEAALRLVAPENLTLIEELNLIRVLSEGEDTIVGVFPPLVAEYITHEGSTIRSHLSQAQIARVDQREIRAPIPEPRPLGTRGGEPILSRRFTQHWSEELRARLILWNADPSPTNAIPLFEAFLISQARPHEVDAFLANTILPGSDTKSHALFIMWQALYLGLARGQVESARALLKEQLPDFAEFDGLFRATDCHLQVVADSVPSLESLTNATAGEDQLSHDSLVVVRAEALVASGQAYAALELLNGFSTPYPKLEQEAQVLLELAQLYTCDFESAVPSALAYVKQSRFDLNPGGVEAHAYVAALGLSLQGRLIELEDLVSSVLAISPTPAHTSHFQTGLLSHAADAAKWQGRPAYARSLAIQSSALGRRRGPHPGMASDGVAAQMRETDDEATADELWELAAERLDQGFLPAGIVAGVSAIERKPDAARAARLMAAADSCDAPLLSHLGTYAVAITSKDPAQLACLEQPLRQAGLRLYAVRTAVTRSMNMLSSGDVVGAAEQADTAWNQAGLRGRDLCGLFRPFDRAVNLTAREREIAVLVARGMNAQEIATMKTLSVRTVENHIFSACRKAGVDNREGLAHAAQTWLSCATK